MIFFVQFAQHKLKCKLMITHLQDHLQRSNLLAPNSNLIVAVSGGVDSVVLLDLLTRLQPVWNWHLSVAHLNHKIRPDSDRDAQLVAGIANQYDLPFYLGQLDGSKTSEAALRKKRYEFLNSIADGAGADYIVTAHHSDDRIETSIFNTVRGADREGMTALRDKRDRIVRPFLPFSKGQIITYANLKNLPFHEDCTNSDIGYSRNFVRHHILPYATVVMPDFKDEYSTRLDRLELLNNRIQSKLEQVLDLLKVSEKPHRLVIKRASFLKLTPLVQLNLLSFVARRLNSGVGLTKNNLDEALKFLFNAKTGVGSNLLPGLQLERRYDNFIITLTSTVATVTKSQPSRLLSPGSSVQFSDLNLRLNDDFRPTQDEYIFIKPISVYVRTWQSGDRIYPVGMDGSKKLQDVFVDKKVPRSLRARWPVVVSSDNEIIWLPGLSRDRRFIASSKQNNYQLICEVI